MCEKVNLNCWDPPLCTGNVDAARGERVGWTMKRRARPTEAHDRGSEEGEVELASDPVNGPAVGFLLFFNQHKVYNTQ